MSKKDNTNNTNEEVILGEKVKYPLVYDGLPIILSGKNRGYTDKVASAEMLGVTLDEFKRILANVKAMHIREPESTISVIEYVNKMREQGLTIDDIGTGINKYQAGREDDEGPYTKDSFKFILMRENLDQRNENNPSNVGTSKGVVTPIGEFDSVIEAAEALQMSVKGLTNRLNSANPKYKGYYFKNGVTKKITAILQESGQRFFSCDNISNVIEQFNRDDIIDDITEKAEAFLRSLMIDVDNDPNAKDTARRISKMYFDELFDGRYSPEPKITAFPNDDVETRYAGMLVTRAEIKSMCSHHHQIVSGTCWIGILPSTKVIGLSKYARLAQWYARRGTLQEELTKQIADGIRNHTGSQDIAVVIKAEHGCCTNRGIMANDSSTWTSVLYGQFYNPSVKQEFFNLIQGNLGGFRCS